MTWILALQNLPALALVSMNITPFSCGNAFEPNWIRN